MKQSWPWFLRVHDPVAGPLIQTINRYADPEDRSDSRLTAQSGQGWDGVAQGADLGLREHFLKELATSETISFSSRGSVSQSLQLSPSGPLKLFSSFFTLPNPCWCLWLCLCMSLLECFSVNVSASAPLFLVNLIVFSLCIVGLSLAPLFPALSLSLPF